MVGHAAQPMTGDKGAALKRNAAIASVSVAILLLILKGWASWRTGSVAMLGSLADSALDLFASLVILFAVVYAAQPADREHRFGHGKAEALAALLQVVLVSLSSLAIGWRSVQRFIEGGETQATEAGIGVSIIAILLTFALIAYQRSVMRRTGSLAIGADSLHYQSDLLLNGAVIAALLLDRLAGIAWIDPLFGLGIAAWLLFGALRSASASIDQLMDREWPEEQRARLLSLAASHPRLIGVHDLRTRTSGNRDFVQFHIWLDPDMTVRKAHEVMDEVEAILLAEFPGVEVLIHTDPEGHVDRHVPPDPLAEVATMGGPVDEGASG